MNIKQIAIDSGMELKKIKCTDPEGRFPPNVGGFRYDSTQIKQLRTFAQAVIKQWISEQEVVGEVCYDDNARNYYFSPTTDNDLPKGIKLIAIPQGEKV